MSQQVLSPVTFHGDTIFCTTYQNQPYTAMKPIVENMGLAWQPQARKLTACKERWGITIMVIPSSSGNQETLCMPVRKLPAFLNTINPKKVKPELRERIELYQAESDDVLWEYWTNQQKHTPVAPTLSTVEDRKPLNTIVRTWAQASHQSHVACWRKLHTAFGIKRVTELTGSRIPHAIAWVQARIDGLRQEQAALPVPAADFPIEVANCGRKATGEPVNLWENLKEAEALLKSCSTGVMLACNSGRSMYLTADKNLFYDMLQRSFNHAEVSLAMAKQAVSMCLSLKSRVDFHTI